jgi:hypothetical protein
VKAKSFSKKLFRHLTPVSLAPAPATVTKLIAYTLVMQVVACSRVDPPNPTSAFFESGALLEKFAFYVPGDWDRVCLVREFATMKELEVGLGRQLQFKEIVRWILDAKSEEGTIVAVFVSNQSGILEIRNWTQQTASYFIEGRGCHLREVATLSRARSQGSVTVNLSSEVAKEPKK